MLGKRKEELLEMNVDELKKLLSQTEEWLNHQRGLPMNLRKEIEDYIQLINSVIRKKFIDEIMTNI